MNITGTITNWRYTMNTQQRIEQLEKELAELKREAEFKEGEWIKHAELSGFLIRYNGRPESPQTGFDGMSNYSENNIEPGGVPLHDYRKATPDEVKAALVKEAERRGFKEGSVANNGVLFPGIKVRNHTIGNREFVYDSAGDTLSMDKDSMSYPVYSQGKWAEIITEPDIVVNGCKAEFCEGYVKFGCARIDNRFFTGMADEKPWEYEGAGKGNRNVTAVKIGEGLFDVETIYQICERLR